MRSGPVRGAVLPVRGAVLRGAVLPVRGDEARGSRPPPRRATRRPRRRFRRRRRLRRSTTRPTPSARRAVFFLTVRLSFARVIESERVDESAGRDVPHDDAAVERGGGDEAAGVDGEGDDRATGRRGRARARGRAETRARLEGGDRGRGSVDVGSRGGVRARRRRRRRRWRRRWRRATARLPGGVRASRVERGSADRRGSAVERGSAVAPIVPVRRTKCRGELGERGVVRGREGVESRVVAPLVRVRLARHGAKRASHVRRIATPATETERGEGIG